ncbi:MAG TPA: hypothetical protein VII86_04820, partial [Thermoanaerobaculia bacterium]
MSALPVRKSTCSPPSPCGTQKKELAPRKPTWPVDVSSPGDAAIAASSSWLGAAGAAAAGRAPSLSRQAASREIASRRRARR